MVRLNNKDLNAFSEPYIIAEIGVNHEGNFKKAINLIDLAKEGGADAVKFQTYKAETIASKDSPSYWDLNKESTTSQFLLFKKYDSFNKNDYHELSNYCKKIGIEFLSTPFDLESVDFLDPLMNFFKIASADINNIPLLRKIASKRKPIILSTGASEKNEINYAISTIEKEGLKKENIILLHCILNYPTKDEDANLFMIKDLVNSYPSNLIGYSDHTLPNASMSVISTAYLMGAVVIEKHFTDDKSLPGNDHYHSMDVSDLKNIRTNTEKIAKILGSIKEKKSIAEEQIARENARRSIVLLKDLPAGHTLKESDLICKRPGSGISPSEWDDILGKKLLKSLKSDHILKWSEIEK